jgi:hypothetical protein
LPAHFTESGHFFPFFPRCSQTTTSFDVPYLPNLETESDVSDASSKSAKELASEDVQKAVECAKSKGFETNPSGIDFDLKKTCNLWKSLFPISTVNFGKVEEVCQHTRPGTKDEDPDLRWLRTLFSAFFKDAVDSIVDTLNITSIKVSFALVLFVFDFPRTHLRLFTSSMIPRSSSFLFLFFFLISWVL